MTPIDADRAFFSTLVAGDAAALGAALTDDFLIVDVIAGSAIPRDMFVGAITAGAVRFAAVDVAEEPLVRRYGDDVAVVTGRTRMNGEASGVPFTAHSRYTHVFVRQDGAWLLGSAQGTPVADLGSAV